MTTPPTTSRPRLNVAQRAVGADSRQARLAQVIDEINALTGLDGVKEQLARLIAFAQLTKVKQARDLPADTLSMHMVFMGPPGTGKTEVARKVGKMLHAIGLLKVGQVIEVDRAGLVAAYAGQTAKMVDQKVNDALGGVLFIDEAYALAGIRREEPGSMPDPFGQEAIDALLKRMEDHKNNLVVIVAGYPSEMQRFLRSNVGLASRFAIRMTFENYGENELATIFMDLVARNQMTLEPEAERVFRQELKRLCAVRDDSFGNAREMRRLFEAICQAQAFRLGQQDDLDSLSNADLLRIMADDVHVATS